jgi:hypothetical protein
LGKHVAVIIDQFEELFFADYPEENREKVIMQLTNILKNLPSVTIIIVVRNDFYKQFVLYETLVEWKKRSTVDIPSNISRKDLTDIVREPAKAVGWQFEPGLVETIVNHHWEQLPLYQGRCWLVVLSFPCSNLP